MNITPNEPGGGAQGAALRTDADAFRRRVEEAADWVARHLPDGAPDTALILGTGLGALAGEIRESRSIPYEEIPGFPLSTAPGHSGRLHHGRLGNRSVIAFEGRFHRYEGYDFRELTLPVRLAARLGVRELVISNASGGLNPELETGDLLVLDDHIHLLPGNPLFGPNHDEWGPRFPDMSAPYDPRMRHRLLEIASEEGIRARAGVYVAVAGPNLETRAEYRMLRGLGADVVGMSTVPEVIVGVHEGLRIAALSVVTDVCDPDHLEPVVLEDILQVAATAEPKLTKMVLRLLEGDRSELDKEAP